MAEASSMHMRRYVGVKETLLYGIANGGQCMSYTFLASYLSYFFVKVFNIEPGAVATMIFVLGIWDTINDPVMGSLIDKTRTRFGKLRPYLLVVPIPLAICTVMLFSGPMLFQGEPSDSIKKIVYMYLSYLIWEMFYTIGDVPFWGLSASISPNPADRTRVITSARFISQILGGLPGIVLAPIIDWAAKEGSGVSLPQVFFVLGLVVSIAGMGLFSLSGVFCKERVPQAEEEPSIWESLKYLFTNKPLMLIVLSNVLGCLGGVFDMYTNYLFIDVIGSATLGLIAGIPGTVINFASYLFIPFFKKRWSNKQIIMITTAAQAIVLGVTFLVGKPFLHNKGMILVILMLRGVVWSIFQGVRSVVPTEMIGDTVDYMELKTGQRSEGMSFSALTFVGKFTGSMAKSFGTLALTWIAYDTSAKVQLPGTQNGIWAFYTIIPGLLGLLAIIPYFFYKLEGDRLKQIRSELAQRHAEMASQDSTQPPIEQPQDEEGK